MNFVWILGVSLVTFLVDTSLEGAGMSRVSPDSCFSARVDIFLRKNHRKILSFQKVTGLDIFQNEKSAKSSTESSSNLFCGLFHVRFLDFDQKFEKFAKFYTKAILFILKHFLKRENERHELEPREGTFRGSACPTFSRPALIPNYF